MKMKVDLEGFSMELIEVICTSLITFYRSQIDLNDWTADVLVKLVNEASAQNKDLPEFASTRNANGVARAYNLIRCIRELEDQVEVGVHAVDSLTLLETMSSVKNAWTLNCNEVDNEYEYVKGLREGTNLIQRFRSSSQERELAAGETTGY